MAYVDRELILVKIAAETGAGARRGSCAAVDIFRGKVIDASPRGYIVEVAGDAGKLKGFIDLVRPLGIKEIVRAPARSRSAARRQRRRLIVDNRIKIFDTTLRDGEQSPAGA